MENSYKNIQIRLLQGDGTSKDIPRSFTLEITKEGQIFLLKAINGMSII